MKAQTSRSVQVALLFALSVMLVAVVFFLKSPSTQKAESLPAQAEVSQISGTHWMLSSKDQTQLKAFSDWLPRYRHAAPNEKSTLLAEGVAIAQERRVVMENLIRHHPTRALQEALPLAAWLKLPETVRSLVEEPFSRIADYSVLPVCAGNHASQPPRAPSMVRLLREAGKPAITAFTETRLSGVSSKQQLPIQGIQLGSIAALRDEVLQELSSADAAAAQTLYNSANPVPGRDFLTGEPLGTSPITALAGGKTFQFASTANLAELNQQLAKLDQVPGPRTSSNIVLSAMLSDPLTGSFNLPAINIIWDDKKPTWTTTPKKVFMIRCDFSDYPDSTHPLPTAANYTTQLNGEVSDMIQCFSYGKTHIDATVSGDIVRLPNSSTYYRDNEEGLADDGAVNLSMLEDAKTTYKENNPAFNEADYDIVGMRFTDVGMTIGGSHYTGLAEVGGSCLLIQGTGVTSVHTHEFGHNYGLEHSNFWQRPAGSANPIDPAGTEIDYGDPFDVMGQGTAPNGCFHSEAKQRLKWLDDSEWVDVTANGSGTYRIHRIDHNLATGIRGLRITRGDDDYFWVNYRRNFDNNWLKAGAYLLWKKAGIPHSFLIDTTPDSILNDYDRIDGAITIGRTYSDPVSNTHITALARGGTTPDEYLDVQVNLNTPSENGAPSGSISGPTTTTTHQGATFTAIATDPDGDLLSYVWSYGKNLQLDERGSNFTFDNNPAVTMRWDTPGTYTVQCIVSDMKGHTTTVTKSVTVTEEITTWNARTNTASGNFHTLIPGSARLLAAGRGSSFYAPLAGSYDGACWEAGQYPSKEGTELRYMSAIFGGCWDGSKYLVAGVDYNYTSGGWCGSIGSSADGKVTTNSTSWTRVFLGSVNNAPLNSIAYGDGKYIAVGYTGQIIRSTNGTNWTVINAGITGDLLSVAYGNGKFIAVGLRNSTIGFVISSTDGQTWTDISSRVSFNGSSPCYFDKVAYLHDRFVFSGCNFGLRYSADGGATFVEAFPGQAYFDNTPAMAYGAEMWYAAGVNHLAGPTFGTPVDLLSTDGTHWARLVSPARTSPIHAAAFFNNTFVTVGDDHTIWQSQPVYATRSSTNLYDWREANFPEHDCQSVPTADADGDGVPNLIEYAFNSCPLTPADPNLRSCLPKAAKVTESPLLADRVSLQFTIPDPALGDVSHVVQVADSLNGPWIDLATKTGGVPWVWHGGGDSRVVSGTPSNGEVQVTVGDSQPISGASHRFLRLKTLTLTSP